MQAVHAFKEIGFFLLAVVVPAFLVVRILIWKGRYIAYQALFATNDPHCNEALDYLDEAMLNIAMLKQIIRFLLFLLSITWFTVPYGRIHGWW